MGTPVRQASFHAGEVSPEFYGRTDHAAYQYGLRLCDNFIPLPHGALVNRPGTKYVATPPGKCYLRHFIFSDAQTFVLAFGDGWLRILTNGGQVLDGLGNPYQLATPWAIGDVPKLKFAQSGDVIQVTHQNYQPREIARVSNANWTITAVSLVPQAFFGSTPILLNFYLIPSNNILAAVYDPAHTYAANDLAEFVDSAGNNSQWISLQAANTGHSPETNPDWWARHSWPSVAGPQPIYKKGDYVFFKGILYFSLADGNINQQPDTSPIWWNRADDATHPAVSATWVITELWRDSKGIVRETLASPPLVSPYGGKFPRYVDRPVTLSWTDGGVGSPAQYKVVGHNIYCGGNNVFGLVGSTDGTTISFQDTGSAPDFTQQPPKGTDPFLVADGVNSATTDKYPAAMTYHEQRAVYAGTSAKPSTFFGSATGQLKRFDVKTPIVASDPYEFALAAVQLEDVRSLLSMNGLLLFTGAAVWSARGVNGGVLSPLSVDVRRRSKRGASYVQPIEIGGLGVYVTAKANRVRAIQIDWRVGFDGEASDFDLTLIARHFFQGHTLLEVAYAEEPYSILWAVREDGLLLSLTFDRESQTIAWAQHPMTGTVESVCCVPEGSEDAVYLVVSRPTGRLIERMASRYITDVRQAWFLDAALSFDGRNTGGTTMQVSGASYNADDIVTIAASVASFAAAGTDIGDQVVICPDGIPAVIDADGTTVITPAVPPTRITVTAFTDTQHVQGRLEAPLPPQFQGLPTTSWGWARDTMTGLAHLNGQTVTALVDGVVTGPFVVAVGAIALNPPGLIVQAGLPYNSDLELLDVPVDAVRPNVKAVERVFVEVVASRGLWAGEDFIPVDKGGTLVEAQQRETEDDFGPPELLTDTIEVAIASDWNRGGRIVLRQADPLPVTIVAAIREVLVGGR